MAAIRRVLIANRGEIAVRIIKTCKNLGISTVAVYSTADEEAVFVKCADVAVCIGAPPSVDSYLRGESIIAVAIKNACDAIHPGYGFLSENGDFAQAVCDAGLIFIGPTPNAIRSMGSKIGAKEILRNHDNIPLIPGYNGAVQETAVLAKEAVRIGFPVLLKASAGGGGKGMRIVHDARELESAIESAKAEAARAFGNPTLLIEKYFSGGRHVEFQIFGDVHGNVIHLNERECSVQRRHQKVIEETPSTALDDSLRRRMAAAAVAVGTAIGYVNAGTVEFIVANDGSFYFLEVNTRLQVEHPITEMTTGLDLVELQFYVASCGNLADRGLLTPPAPQGHAIEARLCAEDPSNDFFPCTGRVLSWVRSDAPYARYDTGIETGSSISIYYDSMIAKIIVHGRTRAEAIQRLFFVLGDTHVFGLTTNKLFLSKCIEHEAFVSGNYNTHFIDNFFPAQLRKELLSRHTQDVAVAAVLCDFACRDRERAALRHIPSSWRNTPAAGQTAVMARIGGDEVMKVSYSVRRDGALLVKVGNNDGVVATVNSLDPSRMVATIDSVRSECSYHHRPAPAFLPGEQFAGTMVYVGFVGGLECGVELVDELAYLAAQPPKPSPKRSGRDRSASPPRSSAKGAAHVAPMPGKVLRVVVKEGDVVNRGDTLLILESMKMEQRVLARNAGTIKTVHVTANQLVDTGAPLCEVVQE